MGRIVSTFSWNDFNGVLLIFIPLYINETGQYHVVLLYGINSSLKQIIKPGCISFLIFFRTSKFLSI